jgi:hypothetical protein
MKSAEAFVTNNFIWKLKQALKLNHYPVEVLKVVFIINYSNQKNMTLFKQQLKPFPLTAFFIFKMLFACNSMAQELTGKEETFYPHHQIALVVAHAHIFDGLDSDGNKSVLSLPSWGVDYTYTFHRKWAIGLHTDIIVEQFKIENKSEDTEALERSYPVAPAIMGIYKPGRHWAFLLGMGAEFSMEADFILTRAGIEYSVELPKNWEVLGTLNYDYKWDAYDSWVFGMGIAKSFGVKK